MRESFPMTITRLVVRPIFYTLFWPRVSGRQYLREYKNKAVVVAGNHIHPLDAAAMGILFPRNLHFLAKIDLSEGLVGMFFRHFGLVFVDRDIKNDSVDQAEKYLVDGAPVGLFPEGTCREEFKKANELLPFKIGAVKMASETGTPIIPMAISGRYKLFSRIKVQFGEPIIIKKPGDLDTANQQLRDVITSLLKKNGTDAVQLPGRAAKNPSTTPPILDNTHNRRENV